MVKKNEKVIITGPSGSGKDWLLRELGKSGLKASLKTTTRPKRSNESQGQNYNFISDLDFSDILDRGGFICHQKFEVTPQDSPNQIWHYGLTNEEFQKSQVFIMTPDEISQIPPELRKGCFLVYLDIPRSIRESRILRRDDKNDSIKRRLDSDEIDFKDFKDFDLRISDPDFDVYMVLDLMF